MVKLNKIRGLMTEHGIRQFELAREIGISPASLSRKMKDGSFGVDEAEKMIKALHIEDPASIFFADSDT